MRARDQRAGATTHVTQSGHPRLLALVALVTAASLSGCPDKPKPRSAGSPCESDTGCDSNLCYTSVCLDPAADDDLDGLNNAIESALGTLPQDPDTDGDGIWDGVEVGSAGAPHDEDGDGLIDAVESLITDADNDCLSAQKDDDEDTPEGDVQALADKGCCCYGSCSESGITVAPASCETSDSGLPVIACPPDLEPDSDDDGTPDNCDPCPDDETNTCDFAPHSLSVTPTSPSNDASPTLSGVAPHAARIVATSGACDGDLVGEGAGTGGIFSLQTTGVPSNTTTELFATAYDDNDEVLGCGGPVSYTHDDIPPAAPTLEESTAVSDGDDLWITGHAESPTTLELFAGEACNGELLADLEVKDDSGEWGIQLTPPLPLPARLSATARDAAGNVSDCSDPLPIAGQVQCVPGDLSTLQDQGPMALLKLLIDCATSTTDIDGCADDLGVTACVPCVVKKVLLTELELRPACARCVARAVPHILSCSEDCSSTLDNEQAEACWACVCQQDEAVGELADCGAQTLCAEDQSPVAGQVEAPYAGPTCLDLEGSCTMGGDTLTPGCTTVTGGVSVAVGEDGRLWSTDVCNKSDDAVQSVGVIEWPVGDGLPQAMDLPNLTGTTSITTYGQSLAIFGMGSLATDPVLMAMGPDEDVFGFAWSNTLEDTELYKRPVLVSDEAGWLYTLALVPDAPVDSLTMLVKPVNASDWVFARGVGLPTEDPWGVLPDLLEPTDFGAHPGLDLALAPPFHLHALLWRASQQGTSNPPMAFHRRFDLTGATVASPADLTADDAVMESINFFPEVSFPVMGTDVVARIDVVAEQAEDGVTTWTPYVAHWIGDTGPFNGERLLLLRRESAPGDVAEWEKTDYTSDGEKAEAQDPCDAAPSGPEDTCTFDLTSERLLDMTGGDGVRMLTAIHTKTCSKSADCPGEPDTCQWDPTKCSDIRNGYRLRYRNASGSWAVTDTANIASSPIEQGAIVIDQAGTVHVVVSMITLTDVVEDRVVIVRHDTYACEGGSCGTQ